MSDSIVRLKVDSSEWNNKLKNASAELNRYMDGCRKAGGTLEILDEGVMDVVKSLGNMETKAQSTRGQLRELTEALTGLTASYRDLSDAERNSETGKAMEEAMSKLTQRAGNLKDAMADVNRAISGQASDTRVFDQLSGGAQMVTASFQTLQGAGKMLGFDIGNDVEVLAKLQAAMAVTTGLTQIQNAVQKESAVMQGVMAVQAKAAAAAQALQTSTVKGATVAQAAFNAVAKANPYVLLASAVAAVGTALFAFSGKAKEATAAIKTNTQAMDEAKRMTDIWRNTLQGTFSSLMTKYDELKRQWISLKDEHQKTEWIKKNQQALAGLGQSFTDVKGAEDFFAQNTDAVVEAFVRRAQAAARVAQLTELYRKQIELLDKKQQTQDAIAKDAQAYGRSAQASDEIKDSSYWNSRYGAINQRTGKWEFHEAGAKLYSGTDTSTAQSVQNIDVQIKANQQEIDKVKGQIENDFKDINVVIPTTSVNGSGSVSKETQNEIQKNEASIAKLTEQYQKLATEAKTADDAQRAGISTRMNEIQGEIKLLSDRNAELKRFAAEAQGMKVSVGISSSLPELNEQLKQLQQAQSQALNNADWTAYGKQIEQLQAQIEAFNGKWKEGLQATFRIKAEVPEEKIVVFKADDTDVLEKARQISGVHIDDKTLTVTALTEDAEVALRNLDGMKPQPKFLTVTALTAEAEESLRKIGAEQIGDKTFRITAEMADSLTQLQDVNAYKISDKEVAVNAETQAAIDKLKDIEGVTFDPKTMTVTANTAESYNKCQELFKDIEGTTVEFSVVPTQSDLTNNNLATIISDIKKQIDMAKIGSSLYNTLTSRLADATAIGNLIRVAIQNGIDTSQLNLDSFWTEIINGEDITDAQLQTIVDKINSYLTLHHIELNFDVGSVSDESNESDEEGDGKSDEKGSRKKKKGKNINVDENGNEYGYIGVGKAASGFSSLISSVEQLGIELPEGLKNIFGGIQAVANILTSIMTIVQAIQIIQNSTSFLPFFANGGVVPHAAGGAYIPGNHYSGDVTPVWANAGEVILTRSQQGNLVSQLQNADGGNGGGYAQPFVSGEQIYLGLTNYLRRSGRGELMTARR